MFTPTSFGRGKWRRSQSLHNHSNLNVGHITTTSIPLVRALQIATFNYQNDCEVWPFIGWPYLSRNSRHTPPKEKGASGYWCTGISFCHMVLVHHFRFPFNFPVGYKLSYIVTTLNIDGNYYLTFQETFWPRCDTETPYPRQLVPYQLWVLVSEHIWFGKDTNN